MSQLSEQVAVVVRQRDAAMNVITELSAVLGMNDDGKPITLTGEEADWYRRQIRHVFAATNKGPN